MEPDGSLGWPELDYARLKPTADTLHLFSQIAGKIRLAHTPWVNHGWHVTLRVSARGLVTPLIPNGIDAFTLEFDLISHALFIRTARGEERRIELAGQSVASFYDEVLDALDELEARTRIVATPSEIPDAIPFRDDVATRPYDGLVARRYHWTLVQVDRVFHRFRTSFLGKVSPVHLFWGSFDLAVTRFSGRPAPLHPGGVPNLPDAVTREAYSHEVSSAGFWPGGGGVEEPCFYSYAYPTPPGFADAQVLPAEARFDKALGEFLLPYSVVRESEDPERTLLDFLETTYAAAADLGTWDRAALECAEGRIGVPRPVPGA